MATTRPTNAAARTGRPNARALPLLASAGAIAGQHIEGVREYRDALPTPSKHHRVRGLNFDAPAKCDIATVGVYAILTHRQARPRDFQRRG